MTSPEDVWTQYDQLDYYGLLGIDAGATTETIQTAYRERIQTFHPDVCPEDQAEETASTITSRLNAAREVLTDQSDRRQYDRLGHDSYCRKLGNADHARDRQQSDAGPGMGDRPEEEARAATDPGAGSGTHARSQPGSETTGDASAGDGDSTTDTADTGAGAASDTASASSSGRAGSSTTREATGSTGVYSDRGGDDTGQEAGTAAGDATATDREGTSSAQGDRTKAATESDDDAGWDASSTDWFDNADDRRRSDEWGAATAGADASTETATQGSGSATTSPSSTSSPTAAQSWADRDGWIDKMLYTIGLILGIPYAFFLGSSLRFSLMGLLAAPVIGFLELWVITGWWMALTKWTLLPLLQGVGLLELVGFAIAQFIILGAPQALIMFGIDGGMGPPEATLTSRVTGLFALWVWVVNLPAFTEPIWSAIPVVGPWLRSASFMQPFFTHTNGPFAADLALQTGAVGAVFIVIHVAVYTVVIGTMLVVPWVQPTAEGDAAA